MLVGILSFFQLKGQSASTLPSADQIKKAEINYRIVPASDDTYGYEVYIDHTLFIRQLTKPCYPGKSGFATKADATMIAELVIAKLKQGIIPPSISKDEMFKLKIHTL